MPYAFLSNALPETPELPAGYELILIDNKEDTPTGYTFVETEDGLNQLVDKAERDAEKAIEAASGEEVVSDIRSDVKLLDQETFIKKYKKADTCLLAIEMGIYKTKTEASKVKEAETVARIYEQIGL